MNVYQSCPEFHNDEFVLRLVSEADLHSLLEVYSDKNAVPFFNADNCHGDDFYYTTLERMRAALNFWQEAYKNGWFVRFAIVDRPTNQAIGTIEEFKRDENDFFTDCGLLRLDLRSDYEKSPIIRSILSLIAKPSFDLFGCSMLATKAVSGAVERAQALASLGFVKSDEPLIGHDGTKYYDYYVLVK